MSGIWPAKITLHQPPKLSAGRPFGVGRSITFFTHPPID